MSFEFKRKEAVFEGVRRIACERIEKALAVFGGGRGKSISDEAVHEARKGFKQIRGLLRLVQGDLGKKIFDRENRTFRDAGRPLSEVRDAKVLADTLQALAEHYKGQLAPNSFKGLLARLEARRRAVRKRVLQGGTASRSIVAAVKKSARRVDDWPLKNKGWKAIEPGLRKTYRQGRDAMRAALRTGSDEAFHEWRKRAKDLRYAAELLVRAWPEAMQPTADAAHHLTDLLGQDHDLAVLEGVVEDGIKDPAVDPERELLKPLVTQRRGDLQQEARELGRKIYAESDDQFIDRIHAYWKAWK